MAFLEYTRVSTVEQKISGAGVAAQRHSTEVWAAREGAVISARFTDEGISGDLSAIDRPGLAEAIAALMPGDTLLVAKRDRISRGDVLAMATIEGAVARRKARIVSAAGEGTEADEPTDILMRRVVDAFSEYQLKVIRATTRNALAAKKRKGQRTGSIPFGKILDADGVRLHDDPEWPRLVEIVLDLRGQSLRSIAKSLDSLGIPTKQGGAKWSPSSVRSILLKTHAGEMK